MRADVMLSDLLVGYLRDNLDLFPAEIGPDCLPRLALTFREVVVTWTMESSSQSGTEKENIDVGFISSYV